MSDHFEPKTSVSGEIFPMAFGKKTDKPNNSDSDPSTSYEVFRNNTTAIEVIVKEVPKNKKKGPASGEYCDVLAMNRLQKDVDRLRTELNKANNALSRSRKGFLAMVREMKKQLDAANHREMETQSKNLALQLDNEKLTSLLLSKSNVLFKLKKEISSMKKVMKYVIKSICNVPQVSENVTVSSDIDYDDFENDLKKNGKVKFACNMFDDMATFDSSVSNTKYTFDKRLL